MDITGINNTINVYSPSGAQGVSTPQVSGGADPDGDGDGGRVHHGKGRGGQMQQVMMQALNSLGLSMPQQTNGSGATGAVDGGVSASSGVKHDMRQFMHALFQAVRGENSSGTAAASQTSGTGDPKANFASGLSALITDVSNGSAPAALQSAFNTLAADLQTSSSGGATDTGSSGAGAGNAKATLQALLTQLQQNMGYGTSTTAAMGNVISTQA